MQASPAWDAAARLRGAVRTPYGDLRLFARKKGEKGADLGGVDGVSEQLNEQGGLGKPNPPPPSQPAGGNASAGNFNTPESQKTRASAYETAKSSQTTASPGSRGFEPGARGFTAEERNLSSADLIARMDLARNRQQGAPTPPQPPTTGQQQQQQQHQPPRQQPQPQQQQQFNREAPPKPAPSAGRGLPKIPKVKDQGNKRPGRATFTPTAANKRKLAKGTKPPTESAGERAIRLMKEAEKKKLKEAKTKASESDAGSTSSARTNRSATSKRDHSPGGAAAVAAKKKDDKTSPAATK